MTTIQERQDSTKHSASLKIDTVQLMKAELTKKDNELRDCYKFIKELTDNSKLSLYALNALELQLKSTQELLNQTSQQNDALFARLQKENHQLKQSNSVWLNRSLKLEYQLMLAMKGA